MATLEEYQQECRANDLTIVSVSFKTSALLNLNFRLTKALNQATRYWWLVIDNGFEFESSWPDSREIVVIRGTGLSDPERESIGYGSLHHAKSLNVGVAYAQSDMVLLLDPDCFIIFPAWISAITAMIAQRQLLFWGTPYHPERLAPFNVFGRTYTYFPTPICMFIFRSALYRRHGFILDFTPPLQGRFYCSDYYHSTLQKMKRQRNNPFKWLRHAYRHGVAGVWDALRLVSDKWSIDKRIDIGGVLYEKYGSEPFGYTQIYFDRRFPKGFQWWSRFFPQSWLGYPKDMQMWRKEPFPFISPEIVKPGRWEQFYFGSEPFALHVGAVTYRTDTVGIDTVRDILLAAVATDVRRML